MVNKNVTEDDLVFCAMAEAVKETLNRDMDTKFQMDRNKHSNSQMHKYSQSIGNLSIEWSKTHTITHLTFT